MPFTDQKDRRKMDRIFELQRELSHMAADVKPGDLCFAQYRKIIREWEKNPRWTTVDTLAAPLYPEAEHRAYFLAFLVFFAFHAVPYERRKQRENGDVTA